MVISGSARRAEGRRPEARRVQCVPSGADRRKSPSSGLSRDELGSCPSISVRYHPNSQLFNCLLSGRPGHRSADVPAIFCNIPLEERCSIPGDGVGTLVPPDATVGEEW